MSDGQPPRGSDGAAHGATHGAATAGQGATHAGARHGQGGALAGLTLGALGVVYGDIGTSPLYAMRETFEGAGHRLDVLEANVLGILSLVFWSLIVVITVKYLLVVMRADNEGEGGILALTSLLPGRGHGAASSMALVSMGLFGTALLYGDGMITPAISVLSAVEGTEVATERLADFVVPISIVILIGIFAVQSRGTGSIGRVFGPVMVVWFGVLGGTGVAQIVREPHVLEAIWPGHAVSFFVDNAGTGFLALGSVFLVVTGGEALYADMGHFGRRPIAVGWFGLVLPGLLLNYFGQGALLLRDPSAIDNPFYRLVPEAAVIPLVVLATMATVIASQALISGAFSLTMQAAQLGYTPRLRIEHTSSHQQGQVYVPAVNWVLMVACIGLVVGFRSSSGLAAAYGVAVTMTMLITTVLFAVVARHRFGWSVGRVGVLTVALALVDGAFLGANLSKVPAGGWFPLVVGGVLFTLLTTWFTGRRLVQERLAAGRVDLAEFVASCTSERPARVGGTAVYLFSRVGQTPPALRTDLRVHQALHERVLVASVATSPIPRELPARRVVRRDLGAGFEEVVLRYGFMERPDVPRDLVDHARLHLTDTVFVLGRETILVTDRPGMARWREHLYAAMARNATSAAAYFRLPPDQVVETGIQVEI